jgi:hypothetical protein
MALIYPVQADAPEPEDDAEPVFSELAADLSDGCFGPLTARAAWDLAVGVDERRPEWMVSVVPLYLPGTVDEVVELFDAE